MKKLDNRAKLPAQIFAYTLGIVGMILMGVNYLVYRRKFGFEICNSSKEDLKMKAMALERAADSANAFNVVIRYETR